MERSKAPPTMEPRLPQALCSVDCTKQFCTLETRQNDIFFQSMDFLWHGRRIRIVQDRAKYCFLAYLYKYVTISFLMVLCRKKNMFSSFLWSILSDCFMVKLVHRSFHISLIQLKGALIATKMLVCFLEEIIFKIICQISLT